MGGRLVGPFDDDHRAGLVAERPDRVGRERPEAGHGDAADRTPSARRWSTTAVAVSAIVPIAMRISSASSQR